MLLPEVGQRFLLPAAEAGAPAVLELPDPDAQRGFELQLLVHPGCDRKRARSEAAAGEKREEDLS